jgi:hypothetical protein
VTQLSCFVTVSRLPRKPVYRPAIGRIVGMSVTQSGLNIGIGQQLLNGREILLIYQNAPLNRLGIC